jgi:hypothetical protein
MLLTLADDRIGGMGRRLGRREGLTAMSRGGRREQRHTKRRGGRAEVHHGEV